MSEIEIKLIEVENVDEFMDSPEMEAFNKETKAYFDNVKSLAVQDLTPEQISDFESWWNGKPNGKEKDDKVQSAILWAIGRGCG